MEYKEYKYVLKISELGNLTKAADELFISQPSLSHYIARVEEELGAKIFNRSTNPISLTPAGEKYCETARMILNLDEKMKKEVSDITENKSGVITLGLSHARASYILPYIMPEFHKKYPGIDIRTNEQKSSLVEEYVSKGNCDMGVLPLPLSGKYELKSESVMKEQLLLVSGSELMHGLSEEGRTYVDFSSLSGKQFTLLKQGHGIRTALETIFMEHDIKPGRIFETTSNETAYRLSTAGMGISIVPESTVLLSSPVSKPYIYSITERGPYWHIAAVYKDEYYLTEPEKHLVKLMQETFSESNGPMKSCHALYDMKCMKN